MTILGYKAVEVENIDDSLCWYIFAPTSPPGGLPLIRLSYRCIFDISTIEHDSNLMEALAACLCHIGIPDDQVLSNLFVKFPEIKSKPVHDYCTWAMTKSSWATKESNARATGNSTNYKPTGKANLDKVKKTTKKKEAKNKKITESTKDIKQTKKPKKPRVIDDDELVEIDDDGNEIVVDDGGGGYDPETNRNDLVFEHAEIPQKRRKLNI